MLLQNCIIFGLGSTSNQVTHLGYRVGPIGLVGIPGGIRDTVEEVLDSLNALLSKILEAKIRALGEYFGA
jgi:hypothetical protein